jgi:hypothetical protein
MAGIWIWYLASGTPTRRPEREAAHFCLVPSFRMRGVSPPPAIGHTPSWTVDTCSLVVLLNHNHMLSHINCIFIVNYGFFGMKWFSGEIEEKTFYSLLLRLFHTSETDVSFSAHKLLNDVSVQIWFGNEWDCYPITVWWPLSFGCPGNLVESILINLYLRGCVSLLADSCVRERSSVGSSARV